MMTKSTLLHLRIPFSFFLSPVFFFALSQASKPNLFLALELFILLHGLLYPASQGFNSYYDRDKDSIGGLKVPPAVTKDLLRWSLLFDVLALVWTLRFHWSVTLLCLIYGLASKLYSHPKTRWKARPLLGFSVVALMQGAGVYLMTILSVDTVMNWPKSIYAAGLASLLIGASYPLTQIYQHAEDQQRGDLTLSRLLGVRGTFIFSAIGFAILQLAFYFYLRQTQQGSFFWILQLALLPPMALFCWWVYCVCQGKEGLSYQNAMKMNIVSSFSINVFFLWLVFTTHLTAS